MKKQVSTIIEENYHRVIDMIGDIAILENAKGSTALQKLTSGQMITPYEKCTVTVDSQNGLVFMEVTSTEQGRIPNTISIYDAHREKMIYDHATIIDPLVPAEVMILRTNDAHSLHLFDKRYYLDDDQLNPDFNGYQKLHLEKNDCFLIVERNSYKGLYSLTYGMLEPIGAHDIREENGRIIIRKDTQETCLLLPNSNTDLFDQIKVDKGNPDIIYCQKWGYNFVYAVYLKNQKEILIPILRTRSEEIEFIGKSLWPADYRGEYRFIITEKGKKHVQEIYISSIEDFKDDRYDIDKTYDNIYYSEGTYYVETDGKVGLLQDPSISPKYEKIVSYPGKIYALYDGEYCDIVRMNITLSILAEHCKILEYRPGGFVLETDTGLALLTYHRNFSEITHCKAIEHVAEEYYILGDTGHKVLYRRGLRLTTDDNLDIKIHGDSSTGSDFQHRGRIYIAMKKENGYSLIISEHNPNGNPLNITGNPKSYENIEFFADFIMIRTSNEVILNSYGYISFHATYPYDTSIRVVGHCGHSTKDGLIYSINGKEYIFRIDKDQGKLLRVDTNSRTLHLAAYESDFGTVVVNSYDEKTFEDTCATIDSLSEEEVDRTLRSYYDTHPKIEECYPKLRFKPTKKTDR